MFGYKKRIKKRKLASESFAKQQDFHWEISNKIFRQSLKKFRLLRVKGELGNIIHLNFPNQYHQIKLFDFSYVISTGNSFVVYNQTVLYAKLTEKPLPDFRLYPKTVFTKLGDFITGANRRYPIRNRAFNQIYKIKTKESPDAIATLFNIDLIDYLNHHKKISLECKEQALILYRPNQLIQLDKVKEAVEEFDFIVTRIVNPRHKAY